MGECQCGLGLILFCKISQLLHHIDQLLTNQLQSLGHYDNIGVVAYIAGGCTKMDNSCCLGTLLSISIYMTHNIMADNLFPFLCHLVINILCVCLQLINLLLGDNRLSILGKTKLHLSLRKCNPELSPGAELHVRGENILHLFAGIALG